MIQCGHKGKIMNLLQKAIIKNFKNSHSEDFNEELALKKGSQSFEETLNQLIKQINHLSKNLKDANIHWANLLLDALKGNQTYTDEQIKKALDEIWDTAFSICWESDYDPEGQKLIDTIDDVYRASI